MILAEVINDMNSSYENRKHGGNSQIFSMQEKMISNFGNIGIENFFDSEMYLPIGQKIEPGTLERLKAAINEYKSENVLTNSSKTLN